MNEMEHLPQDEASPKTEEQEYQPRPRYQRIFAWVLLGILVVGIFFYYFWISHRY